MVEANIDVFESWAYAASSLFFCSLIYYDFHQWLFLRAMEKTPLILALLDRGLVLILK